MAHRRIMPLIALLTAALGTPAYATPPIFESGRLVLSRAGAVNQVVAADIDGDGDADLVLCGAGGLSWAENAASGAQRSEATPTDDWVEHAITAQVALGACTAVTVARFDKDGAVDVGFTGPTEAGVLYNDLRAPSGAGWVLSHLSDGFVGGERVAAADLEHDGSPEYVVLVMRTPRIDFRNNNGTRGGWTVPPDPVTGVVDEPGLVVADVQGDRVPEVITIAPLGFGFSVYRRTGIGWMSAGGASQVIVTDVLAADFDGDGDPDVATFGPDGLAATDDIGGTFTTAGPVLAPAGTWRVTTADLDQDGRDGLVYVDGAQGLFSSERASDDAWTQLGLGASATPSPLALVAIDHDDDGDLDLVVAAADGLYLHENVSVHAAANLTRSIDLPGTFAAPDFVVPGDFDRDGDNDLLVSSNTGPNTRLFKWQAGVWTSAGVVASLHLRGEGVAADFDGDGDLDAVAGSDAGVRYLQNVGAVPWTVTTIDSSVSTDLAVGDLDRDGDPDLVVGSRATGALQWIENTSPGFTATSIDAAWTGLHELALVDVDHDGARDVVVSQDDGSDYHEVAWYQNVGDASAWQRHPIVALDGPAALTAGDLDHDGVVEVVITAHGQVLILSPLASATGAWDVEQSGSASEVVALGAPADFDFDGDLDAVAPALTAMAWLESTPAGARLVAASSAAGVAASALADLDDDGDLDIVAAVKDENRIAVWLDDRESVRLEATALGTSTIARAAPYTEYRPVELVVTHRGVAGDLPIEVLSCELGGKLGSAAVAADVLATWLAVTIYIDADDDRTLDLDETEVDCLSTVVDDVFRFELPAGALVVDGGEAQRVFVAIELGLDPFAGPPADLELAWQADCDVKVFGYDDAPVTRRGLGGLETVTLGVGNWLLHPAALTAEVETGDTVTLDPLIGSVDPDGDPVTLVGLAASASHGVAVDNGDGTLTYASANDGARTDAFAYTLTDGIAEVLAVASVTITVPPQAPYAFAASLATVEDTPASLVLGGGDEDDDATFSVTSGPSHGTVALTADTGLAVYTPAGNYVGADSFAFEVSGGGETSAPATVSITVIASDQDDDDADGIPDWIDNCPAVANASQDNLDYDALGDVCDPDRDGDSTPDALDPCPAFAARSHPDNDRDGSGDVCDDDDDNDGIMDLSDNCPSNANADEADLDGDGRGDVCDADQDGDSVADTADNCPRVANVDQAELDADGAGDACDDDDDADGVPDAVDVCPWTQDAAQLDSDHDGTGDACDGDRDDDGAPTDLDCDDDDPSVAQVRTFYADADGDGAGVAASATLMCAATAPAGHAPVAGDNCPEVANPEQSDSDGDGIGDACEAPDPIPDDDGDTSESEGDAGPEPEPDAEVIDASESAEEIAAETIDDAGPDASDGAIADIGAEAEEEVDAGPEADSDMGPEADTDMGPEADSDMGPEADSDMGPEADNEPEVGPEPEPELGPEPGAETSTEIPADAADSRDDTQRAGGGSGCAAPGTAPGFGWAWALLGLITLVRRRGSRRGERAVRRRGNLDAPLIGMTHTQGLDGRD